MSTLKTSIDSVYAYRFVRLMQKPFVDWKAYEFGIINANGRFLRRPKTEEEKSAYTPFHASVRSVKRLVSTVPGLNTATYLTQAYSAISSRLGLTESVTTGDAGGDPINIASGNNSGSIVHRAATKRLNDIIANRGDYEQHMGRK